MAEEVNFPRKNLIYRYTCTLVDVTTYNITLTTTATCTIIASGLSKAIRTMYTCTCTCVHFYLSMNLDTLREGGTAPCFSANYNHQSLTIPTIFSDNGLQRYCGWAIAGGKGEATAVHMKVYLWRQCHQTVERKYKIHNYTELRQDCHRGRE